MYNVTGGGGTLAQLAHAAVEDPEGVLQLCTEKQIAYLPFFPLSVGRLSQGTPALSTIAQAHGATPA